MRSAALALLALAAFACPTLAVTIHVPDTQPTIQAGLSAAANGDTVLVAPGIYTGPANQNLDFAGKAVVLRSSAGAAATIIDCQSAGRGFTFHSGETPLTVVEGFTLRNGVANLDYGGGMFMDGASPAIRNCVLTACRANTGGAFFLGAASPQLEDCTVSGNSADNFGGGMYCEAASAPSFAACTVTGNTAAMGAGFFANMGSSVTGSGSTFALNAALNLGGAIRSRGATLTLSGCGFDGNTSKKGAGIYCSDGATAALDLSTFTGNVATFSGGGIWGDTSSLALTRCTFTDNATLERPGTDPRGGGGITLESLSAASTFSMSDCVFTGNRTLGGGPANGAFGGGARVSLPFAASIAVSRCEFRGNHAEGGYGGLTVYAEAVRVEDCLFADNTTDFWGGGLTAASRSRATAVARCTFLRNHASGGAGGFYASNDSLTVTDCTFTENTSVLYGGGMYRSTTIMPFAIRGSRFTRNFSTRGGGLYLATGSNEPSPPAHIEDCVFDGNTATIGGGALLGGHQGPGAAVVSRCTLVRNGADLGGGLNVAGAPLTVTIEHTVIAAGTQGEAVRCDLTPPVLACTDISGNAGGDWVGCIADQYGINGCFAADPRFCNPLGGDFTLAEDSPCSPAHSPGGCGLIGALPVGCVTPIALAEAAPRAEPAALRIVPNPIIDDAIVEWTGARGAIEVIDPLGRVVLQQVAWGAGQARWSEIARGRRVASGVYFLRAGGGVVRVLVMR